jgi:hypothetical protein
MPTPLPIIQLPVPYGPAGLPFVFTDGDNVNDNIFSATGAEVLVAYNSDVASAGEIILVVSATSGTFTLTYGGQTTGSLAFNIAASGATSIQTALNALLSAPAGGFTVTGVVAVGGADGVYRIQGPVGAVLTALTATTTLTGNGTDVTIFPSSAGSAGTSHALVVKSAADVPFGRLEDINDTLLAGQYRVYQQFPTGGWASNGNIQVNPASAMILLAVFRVTS